MSILEPMEFLDQKWYQPFESIGSFMAHEFFHAPKNERELAKKAFLSEEVYNPILSYPHIDIAHLTQVKEGLQSLKGAILKEEMNPYIKAVYTWKIEEKIVELKLLKASAKEDMIGFKKYAQILYGEPSEEVFLYSLQVIEREAKGLKKSDDQDSDKIAAAHDLLDALSPFSLKGKKGTDSEDFSIKPAPLFFHHMPHETLIEQVCSFTKKELKAILNKEKYSELERDAKNEVHYTPQKMKELIEHVLKRLKAEGWQVFISSGSSRKIFSMNQQKKRVNLPDKNFSAKRAMELLAHEFCIHLRRRLNGEKSALKLLGLGLDGYSQGEEGLASLIEDSIKPSLKDFFGLDRHLAISLAMGLDGQAKDFRGVFEIMEKYYYFKQLLSGKPKERAKKGAQNQAWANGIRTFRGTDCQTKGVCYPKDIIYREGNIKMWKHIHQNGGDDFLEKMSDLLAGKFDAANSRHLWIMIRLGLRKSHWTEEKLDEMDKRFIVV